MTTMTTALIVAALFGLLAVIVVWTARTDRRNKRRMAKLASALGAVPSGTGGEGVCDGVAYRFHYSPAARNSPATLKVSIDSPAGQPLRIVREGRAERLSKRIGLSAEIQTGDPAFDADLYIETEADEFTRTLLMRDDARQAVRDVFQLGFTAVHQDGRRLQAVWSPFKLRDDMDPALITGAVAPLATLASRMPAMPPPARPARTPIAKAVVAAAVVMAIAALVLWLVADRFRPLDGGAVLRDSLRYSIPALVVWLAFAFVQLRGRSTAHKELVLVVCLSAFAFGLGGDALEVAFNGWADLGSPTSHDTEVIRTYRRGGRTTTYHVVVTSWRRPRQAENLVVSSGLYRAARPHQHVTVVTKPGRLGFEWIVSYALAGAVR